jgi:hypothetical protein
VSEALVDAELGQGVTPTEGDVPHRVRAFWLWTVGATAASLVVAALPRICNAAFSLYGEPIPNFCIYLFVACSSLLSVVLLALAFWTAFAPGRFNRRLLFGTVLSIALTVVGSENYQQFWSHKLVTNVGTYFVVVLALSLFGFLVQNQLRRIDDGAEASASSWRLSIADLLVWATFWACLLAFVPWWIASGQQLPFSTAIPPATLESLIVSVPPLTPLIVLGWFLLSNRQWSKTHAFWIVTAISMAFASQLLLSWLCTEYWNWRFWQFMSVGQAEYRRFLLHRLHLNFPAGS